MKNVTKNDLINDERFYIDDWNADRVLSRPVDSYSMEEIPVGKIRRYINHKVISLEETDVFRFLSDFDNPQRISDYQNYCETECAGNSNRGINQFRELIHNFENNTYNPMKGIIIVDQYYFIIEGQHRSCILLKEHGPDYRIKVLKLHYVNNGVKTFVKNQLYNIKNIIRKKNY